MHVDPDELLTRSAALRLGISDTQLHARCARGSLVRVNRGTFADGRAWAALDPREQYRLRVIAAAGARSESAVVSHSSAAALHRMAVLAPDRRRVHVTLDGNGGGKKSRTSFEHRVSLVKEDCVDIDGVRVTSLGRTALDLACDSSFAGAVCAVESALRSGAIGLEEALARMGRRTGIAMARRAVAFASPLTESIGESWSRALIDGWPEIPEPRLQNVFRTREGLFVARTDFDWECGLVGEFDGLAKYEAGSSTVVQEKLRQDKLTALGLHVVRWTWADLQHPQRLRRLLVDGLALASR